MWRIGNFRHSLANIGYSTQLEIRVSSFDTLLAKMDFSQMTWIYSHFVIFVANGYNGERQCEPWLCYFSQSVAATHVFFVHSEDIIHINILTSVGVEKEKRKWRFFLLLSNYRQLFFFIGNPLYRKSLWRHTSEKTVGMFIWRNYILGEISLLHSPLHFSGRSRSTCHD